MKILILSPHADDAAFSCGDHIIKWKKQGIDITVCTVFTKFKTSLVSKDVQWYLDNSGFSNVLAFEEARSKEDNNALNYLRVKFTSPNLTDGAFRIYKNQLVYPTFDRLFSGKISILDEVIITRLNFFLKLLEGEYNYIIAPLGIGNHADHLITSLCAKKCLPNHQLGFYTDVPYYFNHNNWNSCYLKNLFKYKKSIKWTSKKKLISLKYYTSQTRLIIRNNKQLFFNQNLIFFPEIILLPGKF